MGPAHQRDGRCLGASVATSDRKSLLITLVLRKPLFLRIQRNVGLLFVIDFRNI